LRASGVAKGRWWKEVHATTTRQIIGLDAWWLATAYEQGLVEIGFELMTHEDDSRDSSSSLKTDI